MCAGALAHACAGPDGWIRAINLDEGRHGDLDRDRLDAARANVPVRVQHRSGALWVLNTAALRALGLGDTDGHPTGVESDASGRPTGRLWRMDGWLRERTRSAQSAPDLAALGSRCAAFGLTGVTDATPDLDQASMQTLEVAHAEGNLPQRIHVLAQAAPAHAMTSLVTGPVKVVVADHEFPALDSLIATIADARSRGRAVAVHCVSRAALLLALAAFDGTGTACGDRIEHAAVASPPEARRIAAMGVRVVTQPALPRQRGDDYLERTEANDRPFLWPYRSLLSAGVGVGCSSDAPYGELDPWLAIRAATERRTSSGRVLGNAERVDAHTALAGYLSDPTDPGGPPRRICRGGAADLVLLKVSREDALADPAARHVRMTMINGRIHYEAS